MHSNNRRQNHIHSERGQTMAEYAVLVSVIALVVLATLPQLASTIESFFTAALDVFGG